MRRLLQIAVSCISLIGSTTFAHLNAQPQGSDADSHPHTDRAAVLSEAMDLQTAVLYSLNRNPNIAISRANVALRGGQLQSAGGDFDWTPFATAGYQHTEAPLITLLSSSDTLIEETVEYSVGLRKKFRNGITLTPSASAEIDTRQAIPDPRTATSLLNLEVLIPLLRGSGVTSANAVEQALDYDLQAAQLAYLQVLSDQALATTIAYWRYAASSARVSILASIETRAQNLLDTTQAMIDAKILSASTLPQARANLNDQRALSLAARIDCARDRYAFALALGLQSDQFLQIPTTTIQDHTPTQAPLIEYGDLIRLTNTHRADINSVRKSLQGREVLVDGAKRDLLPRLDLTLSGGYAGGSRETETLDVLNDNLRGPNFGVEVQMDFPVSNNFQQGRLAQQRAEFHRIEQELIGLKQRVTASAMESLEVLKLASERLEVIQNTELQYEEAVKIASEQFGMGATSTFELIDIEGRYARSTIDSVIALRDYYIAVARLRFETGTLFKTLSSAGDFTLSQLDDPNILTADN